MANCDCYNERVSTYTGSISGNPQANVNKIHYCPTHAAAPELLRTLRNLTGCFSTNMLDQNDNLCREYWKDGLDAIAKAEGG